MNKIKTRRSPGPKILGMPVIKEIKAKEIKSNILKNYYYGLTKREKNNFRS